MNDLFDDSDAALDQLYLCQLDSVAKKDWRISNDEFMTNLDHCFDEFLQKISPASYYVLLPHRVGMSHLLTMILWGKIKTSGILYPNRKIYGNQNVLILVDSLSSATRSMIDDFLNRNKHNSNIKIHVVAPYLNDDLIELPSAWQLYTVKNAIIMPVPNTTLLIDKLSKYIGPALDY